MERLVVRAKAAWSWARREVVALLAILAAAGGLWLFAEIADEVAEGEAEALDRRIVLAFRRDGGQPLGPVWLQDAARDVTALGSVAVLALFVAAAVGYQLLERHYGPALLIVLASAGGGLLTKALKELFDRPRPDHELRLVEVATASFPSGHSMASAAIFLTLGALLARLEVRRRAKVYFLAVAVFLTLLVGSSRVYLGVHYPTDVLAGWAAGSAWALICWLAAWWLQRRRVLEEGT